MCALFYHQTIKCTVLPTRHRAQTTVCAPSSQRDSAAHAPISTVATPVVRDEHHLYNPIMSYPPVPPTLRIGVIVFDSLCHIIKSLCVCFQSFVL